MHASLKSIFPVRLFSLAALWAAACFTMAPAFADDTKPDQEAKLIASFANATLQGRWAPVKDGQLGPEKEDAYQIVSAQKMEGDHWQINARIQYGGKTFDLPVPAVVQWAGDTVVLLFDNISIGTPRVYSARLVIHENSYAGTWSGGDHSGMLYGVIKHETK